MATVSGITQEAQLYTEKLFGMMVASKLMSHPIMDFLLRNKKIWPAANLDEAQYVTKVVTNTGTVGTIDANGVPTGVDFNETRTPHEDIQQFSILAPFATIKRENVGELASVANAMLLESQASGDMSKISTMLKSMSFADVLKDEMVTATVSKIIDDFITWLKATESATIYSSDTIVSGSAQPIWANINKISGAFDSTTQKELYYRQATQKDHNGKPSPSSGIDTVFAENTAYYNVKALLYPDKASNIQSRTLMNPNGDIAIIPAPLTTSDSFVFGPGHGFKFVVNKDMPEVFMTEDKFQNVLINVRWGYLFSLAHRLDLYMFNNA